MTEVLPPPKRLVSPLVATEKNEASMTSIHQAIILSIPPVEHSDSCIHKHTNTSSAIPGMSNYSSSSEDTSDSD